MWSDFRLGFLHGQRMRLVLHWGSGSICNSCLSPHHRSESKLACLLLVCRQWEFCAGLSVGAGGGISCLHSHSSGLAWVLWRTCSSKAPCAAVWGAHLPRKTDSNGCCFCFCAYSWPQQSGAVPDYIRCRFSLHQCQLHQGIAFFVVFCHAKVFVAAVITACLSYARRSRSCGSGEWKDHAVVSGLCSRTTDVRKMCIISELFRNTPCSTEAPGYRTRGLCSCWGGWWNNLWLTALTSLSVLLPLVGDSGAKLPVARIALPETNAQAGSLALQHSWDPLQQWATGQVNAGWFSVRSSMCFGTCAHDPSLIDR